MKGGDAVILTLAATVPEPRPRRHVRPLRGGGDRVGVQRAAAARGERPPPARGRLRDPDGAVQRRRRGRLPGHAPGRGPQHRGARALGPQLDGQQRDPPGRRRSWTRLNDYEPRRPVIDGLTYPRGPQRGRHPRRGRRQRAARRVRGRGEPPLRPRPQRGGGGGVRPRVLRRGTTSGSPTPRRARCPGCAVPAARAFVDAVGGRGEPEVRLDRRRALHRAGGAGGQLRPRRPDARPTSRRSTCRSRRSEPASGSCGAWLGGAR